MKIDCTRFGNIEVEDERVITLPGGMIGFPQRTRFVLLEPKQPGGVAWLQSLDTAELAFPVLDGGAFGPTYPEPDARSLATSHGIDGGELAVFVVVVARAGAPLTANLLAPVVVGVDSRRGGQVVLDPARYATRVPIGAPIVADGAPPAGATARGAVAEEAAERR